MATKVHARDIKDLAFLTTGTAPDYAIAVPRVGAAYAELDREKFTINFHSAGSGTITINISGLGVKTLTDVDSVEADEYMTIIYDSSQDVFVQVDGGDSPNKSMSETRTTTGTTHTVSNTKITVDTVVLGWTVTSGTQIGFWEFTMGAGSMTITSSGTEPSGLIFNYVII